MAEGWCRHLQNPFYDVYSAGIETHGLNPDAVRVMAEVGVDISSHRSQHVDELSTIHFDIVVTVCGHAHEHCPLFSNAERIVHVGFDDPPALAKNAASEEEALNHYRRVRDEIHDFIAAFPASLPPD